MFNFTKYVKIKKSPYKGDFTKIQSNRDYLLLIFTFNFFNFIS